MIKIGDIVTFKGSGPGFEDCGWYRVTAAYDQHGVAYVEMELVYAGVSSGYHWTGTILRVTEIGLRHPTDVECEGLPFVLFEE